MKKFLFLFLSLYFLCLLQTSFLVHFSIKGIVLNLVLIAVVLINIFENPREITGIFLAGFGGLFLDIFSERFFGFWIIVLLLTAVLLKFILKEYVRFPTAKRA
jgi:rod shape-determining protein MreD